MGKFVIPVPDDFKFDYKTDETGCWHHSIRFVRAVCGKSDKHPINTKSGGLEVKFGMGTPVTVSTLLRGDGFQTDFCHTRGMSDEERVALMKRTIAETRIPVILLVGISCWGFKQEIFPHYISIGGWDEDGFFVYSSDTGVKKKEVPIGNTHVPYQDLLRLWGNLRWTSAFDSKFWRILKAIRLEVGRWDYSYLTAVPTMAISSMGG